MFRFVNDDIQIELSHRLSVYQRESAVGKTYLPTILNMTERVFVRMYATSYDYDVFLRDKDYERFDDKVLYFFDRYDLFGSFETTNVLKDVKNGYVLVDCKSYRNLIQYYAWPVEIRRIGVRGFVVKDAVID